MSKLTFEIDSSLPLNSLKVKVDDIPVSMVASIHLNGFASECSALITLLDADQPDMHSDYLTAYGQLSKFKNIIDIKTLRLY